MSYITLYIIMLVIFTSYVSFISAKYGIQTSISESYYVLPRNLQWLFTMVTWGYAFPAIIIGVPFSGLAFLAGAGICFVGASPAFRGKDGNNHTMERTVHMVGAIIGVTAAQVLISFVLGYWWITLGFIIFSALTFLIPKMKVNITWWIEIYAFIGIALAYLLIL